MTIGMVAVARLALNDSTRIGRDDHVDLEAHQLRGKLTEPVGLSCRVPDLEDDVLAFDVSEAA
jgi:hypothetical protein